MSLSDAITITVVLVKHVYKLAVTIRDSKKLHVGLREMARYISTDLIVIESILDNLQNLAERVSIQDEIFVRRNIELLKSIIDNVKTVLEEVQQDRNFLQRLFMKTKDYQRRLHEVSKHLNNSCMIIQGALPTITKVQIPRREFPDFRKIFQNIPDTSITFYEFSFVESTSPSVVLMTFEKFDSTRHQCYMKLGNEQFFVGYQLRTWWILDPKHIVLEQRQKELRKDVHANNNQNATGHLSEIDLAASTSSTDQAKDSLKKFDFSEFFMAHDDLCGLAVARSNIYIATKHEIIVVPLTQEKTIAQYGTPGDGPNLFDHISYIYIPPNDRTSLYIVDRGQYTIHLYRIDDSGLRFEYVRRYVVIANVNQQCNLISCVIYNNNLYVSDRGNNCLHIFPLNGERQSCYLADNFIMPFSPGSLCAHGKYLYVANCLTDNPGILVFNEECQPIDWFRHRSIQDILAMEIDPNINELYILTISKSEDNTLKKRPLIVSMDLLTHT